MGNVTIFEEGTDLPTVKRKSALIDNVGGSGIVLNRILTTNSATFKRMVDGEQIGKAIRNSIDVIVVQDLKEVSREYYATAYDPDAKATLPDCWSNLGDRPEVGASDPQAKTCANCPQNVAGSGIKGKGRACKFKRRLAVLAVGDAQEDLYQLNVPAMSLFGDPEDSGWPYESYRKYLKANGEGVDSVVTRVEYDSEAESMVLKFRPVRHLTQEESDLVDELQASDDVDRYTQLTLTAPAKQPALAFEDDEEPKRKPKPEAVEDEDDEDDSPPKRRKGSGRAKPAPAKKASVLDALEEWDA